MINVLMVLGYILIFSLCLTLTSCFAILLLGKLQKYVLFLKYQHRFKKEYTRRLKEFKHLLKKNSINSF